MRDHRSGSILALGLTIAMVAGCRGEAPPPVVQRPTMAAAAKHPSQPAPMPAQPVVLRKPDAEALPLPVAVPKKKIGETLKQAQLALNAGRLDERSVPFVQAPPELNDVTAPTVPASKPADDALAMYRSVLMIDPNNAAALRGMDAVVAALHARAHESLIREDMVSAQRDADRLKLLRPDEPGLPALTASLNKGWRVASLIATSGLL